MELKRTGWGCLEEPLGRDDRQKGREKKMHTQKEANQKTRKPPQTHTTIQIPPPHEIKNS